MSKHEPPFAHAYWPNVLLVAMTLFPGLINSTALAVIDPVVAQDFGLRPEAIQWVPLLADATLAFGVVIGAEVARRYEGRRWYLRLQLFSIAAAILSAGAPNVAVLTAGHALQGLATGMLFILALPPLVTGFPEERLPITIGVLVGALFGAATLGPPAGGALAYPFLWRIGFAANALLAIAAFALAHRTVAERPPGAPDEPRDVPALVLSIGGVTAIFIGVALLQGRQAVEGLILSAIGGVAVVALLVVELRSRTPLMPIRKILTAYPILGACGTIAGSVLFIAVMQAMLLTLERVHGLSPGDAGVSLWPDAVAATSAAVVVGCVVRTPYIPIATIAGIAALTAAAFCVGAAAHAASSLAAVAVSVLASFGAGLTVTPGLLTVGLSVERAIVGRAIALVQLYRLSIGYLAVPIVTSVLAGAAAKMGGARSETAPFIAGNPVPHAAELIEPLRSALAATFTLVGIGGAVVAVALIAILVRAGLRVPDYRAFLKEGQPALDSRRI